MLSLIDSKGLPKEAHSGIQADIGSAIFDTSSQGCYGYQHPEAGQRRKMRRGPRGKFSWTGSASDIPFLPNLLVKFSWKCKLVLGPGGKEKEFGE